MSACLGTDRTGTIEFRLLTRDKVEDALAVQRETMRQECIAIGVGMYEDPGAPEEMQLAFREVVKDGCTVIGVDRSDRTVAVAFNKLHVPLKPAERDPFELFVRNNIQHRSCRDLFDLLDHVEAPVDVFQRYNAKGAMEIFYIGTDSEYQGRGIGRQITEKSLEVARGLRDGGLTRVRVAHEIVNEHVRPDVVFCVAASTYSQRIMARLNFQVLNELRYEELLRAGGRMSDRIGHVHQTVKYVAREL